VQLYCSRNNLPEANMDNNTINQISIWSSFALSVLQVLGILLAMWVAGKIMLQNPWRFAADEDGEDLESFPDPFPPLPDDADVDEDVEAEQAVGESENLEANTAAEMDIELEDEDEGPPSGSIHRAGTLLLWLALAGMLFLPITDLLVLLRTLIGLGLGWSIAGSQIFQLNPVNTIWGAVPSAVYSLLFILLMLLIYGVSLTTGGDALSNSGFVRRVTLSRGQRTYLLLGIGSLIYELVQGFVLSVVRFELPAASPLANSGSIGFIGAWLLVLLLVGLGILLMNSNLLKRQISEDEGA
jgi:hypothetical protein